MHLLVRPWFKAFDFHGRATRSEYLLFHVTAIATVLGSQTLLGLFTLAVFGPGGPVELSPATIAASVLFSAIWLMLVLTSIIGHISVSVRRLHDHGEPGSRYLLSFIPLIGVVFWLMLVFAQGHGFENEYGPDPRNPEPDTVEDLRLFFS
jgi:uncharacterized membrane protein YhaH (DUF805 family)